jgi:hypothetical protein
MLCDEIGYFLDLHIVSRSSIEIGCVSSGLSNFVKLPQLGDRTSKNFALKFRS